jgi:hypothetical protein
VDFSGTGLKALKCFLPWLVELIVDKQSLGSSALFGHFSLAVDEVDWEALWVLDGEDVPSSRGIFHFLDAVVEDRCAGDFRDSGDIRTRFPGRW